MYPYLELGDLRVQTYHILMVVGFIVAIVSVLIINKRHPLYHLPPKEILFLSAFIIIGALLGGRLLFFLTHLGAMIQDPSLILPVLFSGGLVFYGGLIGGIGVGYFYIRRYRLDPLKYVNLFIVALPLGHGCGRIGCFMAGCCHGKPTDSIFGVVFPFEASYPYAGVRVHPTQLYEALFNIVLFLTMLFLFFKYRKRHRPYIFVSLYLVAYGTFRFFNEFLRGDEIRGVWLLSTSQWISLILVTIGILIYWFKRDVSKMADQGQPTIA